MLDLKLFLEEDDDINIDIEITEDEVNISIKETEDKLTDLFNKLDHYSETLENLVTIRNNILKFGVSKELLSITNSNNELGTFLGISLPHCEDENIDQIDEKELPDVEVFVESFNDKIMYIYEILLAAVKEIIEDCASFFRFYKIKALYLKTKIKKFNENLKKIQEHAVDYSKLDDIKISGYNYPEWKAIVLNFNTEWDSIIKLNPAKIWGHVTNNPKEIIKNPNSLNSVLVQFDHMLQLSETNMKIVKLPEPSPEKIEFEKNVSVNELNYSIHNIKEGSTLAYNAMGNIWEDNKVRYILNQMQLINSTLYRNREDLIKRTHGQLNMFNNWDENSFKLAQSSLKVYHGSVKIISKGIMLLVNRFFHTSLQVINKFPEISEPIKSGLLQIEHKPN